MTRLYKRISMPINRDLVPFLREAKPENFAYLQRREGSFFYSEGGMGGLLRGHSICKQTCRIRCYWISTL